MRAPLRPPPYPRSDGAVKRRFRVTAPVKMSRSETISKPSLFVQSSAAIDGLYAVTSAREFVSRISGDEMKQTRVRLPKNTLFQGDAFQGGAPKPDLEALANAKVRQDASHRKLDRFITLALAELNDDRNA